VTVNKWPLRLLYFPLQGFCIDMPQDDKSTGRLHVPCIKGNILNQNKPLLWLV